MIIRGEDFDPTQGIENLLLCGDSISLLKKFPDNSVHLILSDIPYGIGLDSWDVLHNNTNIAYMGKSPAQEKAGSVFKFRGKPINGWSEADKRIPQEYYEWCKKWTPEWFRVLKPGGSAFVFAGRRFAPRCVVALEEAGFNFRDMLAWVKGKAAHRAQHLSIVFDRRGKHDQAVKWKGWRLGNLRPLFEPIIWCFKPYKLTITDNVLEHELGAYNEEAYLKYFSQPNNIIECAMESDEGGLHPAQKPVRLMEALIELVTREDHLVLDPFAGSGSTVIAAQRLNRRFIAIEIDPEMCAVIEKRLNSEKAKLRLL